MGESAGGRLRRRLAAGDFAVTAEIRDRNRIALQSDLLGASALGILNFLVMTGDHPMSGDHPAAKPVFDLDSVQLLEALRAMRDEHTLLSGRPVDPPPDCFLGAVENPFAAPMESSGLRESGGPGEAGGLRESGPLGVERLGRKVVAGAQFIQTQFVYDVAAFGQWMTRVRDQGWHERCAILAGVGAVRSLRTLEFMREKLSVNVPDDVDRRLRGVPADRVAAEGARLAAETIAQLRQLPGVAGVHLMVSGDERLIPAILDAAGLPADRRDQPRKPR